MCKLRDEGSDVENEDPPMCKEEENVVHTLLKRNETQMWREKFVDNNWLYINEEMVHKKIISCSKITEF